MKHTFFLVIYLCMSVFFMSCQKDMAIDASYNSQDAKIEKALQAAATGICDFDLNESTLTTTGWSKIFEDNFSTNLNQWNAWYGGAFNNEIQMYQAANCTISNGILSITAKKEAAIGPTTPFDATPKSFTYTSGRLESKTNFSSSRTTPKVRMIARLKLPSGYGMWPAFWSYGDPWPTQGEIDIMEARGHEPFSYITNYFYGRRSGVNLVPDASAIINTSSSLTDCWHVFEVIWTKNSLTFLFDGQIVDVKSGGYIPNLYGKTERITLNLAVGGLFFPNFDPENVQTGTYQIDWVKVFKSN